MSQPDLRARLSAVAAGNAPLPRGHVVTEADLATSAGKHLHELVRASITSEGAARMEAPAELLPVLP